LIYFTSLPEINHYFRQQIDLLNLRKYKGSSFSRRDLFEQQERSILREFPTNTCLLKKSVILTVQRNDAALTQVARILMTGSTPAWRKQIEINGIQ
jgi:hypothetical protein